MNRAVEEAGQQRAPTGVDGTNRVAFVLSCGAFSKPLAAQLGYTVPLDTERGYHITLPNPGVMPQRPIYSGDHSFAVTPLEIGLRFAGTVAALGEGITELMCHPGYPPRETRTSYALQRAVELATLTSALARQAIVDAGVTLGSFADLG